MVCKNAISLVSSGFVRIMCVFCGFMQTQINVFSSNGYVRLPFFAFRMPRNALIPRFVIFLFGAVHAILLMCNFSQVGNSIVGTVSVNMVNFSKRPRVIDHSPNNPVGRNYNFVYAYFYVAKTICSSHFAFFCPPSSISPCQIARFRVIRQFIMKRVDGYLSHAHNILQVLNGVKYGVA